MAFRDDPTYYHVIDDMNGEHIATFTSSDKAYKRCSIEAIDNGRVWCYVTTAQRTAPQNFIASN